MLFEVEYDGQKTSIVLNKIAGVSNCRCEGKIKAHIFTIGDTEGYNTTEPYEVICARLNSALEKVNQPANIN